MLWRTWIALFLSLLLSAPIAIAEHTPAHAETGLLWKVERHDLPASWLFGTIHLTDPEVARLPENASKALLGTQLVVTELKLDDDSETQFLLILKEMLSPNRPLLTLLGEKDHSRLVGELQLRGYPEPLASQLRPWAAWMLMLQPARPSDAVQPLDMQIAEFAKKQHIPNLGLETTEEQLALFKNIEPFRLRRLILTLLNHPEEQKHILRELTAIYQRGDLSALHALSTETETLTPEEDRAWEKAWMQEINDGRNLRMAQRLQPLLKRGSIFVAVGALHLPGPNGLIAHLRAQGYQVTPAPSSPKAASRPSSQESSNELSHAPQN